MTNSRRDFLKNSALLLAGSSLLSQTAFGASKKHSIKGVQLYSVRDDMPLSLSFGVEQKLDGNYSILVCCVACCRSHLF